MFTIYVRIDLRIPPSLVFRNNCTVRERERENESGFSNFVERAATDAATLSQKRGGGRYGTEEEEEEGGGPHLPIKAAVSLSLSLFLPPLLTAAIPPNSREGQNAAEAAA